MARVQYPEGAEFFFFATTVCKPAYGVHTPSYTMISGTSFPDLQADHLPVSNAEV
jgi:hypothetical protein